MSNNTTNTRSLDNFRFPSPRGTAASPLGFGKISSFSPLKSVSPMYVSSDVLHLSYSCSYGEGGFSPSISNIIDSNYFYPDQTTQNVNVKVF
jgi:hypothetical protein